MAGLNKLAMTVLQHGDKMSVDQMARMMQAWVPSAPRYIPFLDNQRSKIETSQLQYRARLNSQYVLTVISTPSAPKL